MNLPVEQEAEVYINVTIKLSMLETKFVDPGGFNPNPDPTNEKKLDPDPAFETKTRSRSNPRKNWLKILHNFYLKNLFCLISKIGSGSDLIWKKNRIRIRPYFENRIRIRPQLKNPDPAHLNLDG